MHASCDADQVIVVLQLRVPRMGKNLTLVPFCEGVDSNGGCINPVRTCGDNTIPERFFDPNIGFVYPNGDGIIGGEGGLSSPHAYVSYIPYFQ